MREGLIAALHYQIAIINFCLSQVGKDMRIAQQMNLLPARQLTLARAKITDGSALARQVRVGTTDSANYYFLMFTDAIGILVPRSTMRPPRKRRRTRRAISHASYSSLRGKQPARQTARATR